MFLFLHYSFGLCCKKSTRWPVIGFGVGLRWQPLAFLILVLLATLPSGDAQEIDTFDEPFQKFVLWDSDAKAQLSKFRQTEPGVEIIETSFERGTKVYLTRAIEPCVIIDDLKASMKILTAQSGMRIGFRVVFPRSAHPATHDPITEVLLGNANEGMGRWSTSTIAEVPTQFEERVRYLKTKFGAGIDLQDAYIDAVVLSVYTNPGTIRIKVDDLRIDGMVSPMSPRLQERAMIGGLQNTATLPVQEQLRVLQATVPRWILHQGESLHHLKSLGFTAIITNNPNDPLIAEQALGSQMGVIARPPDLVPTQELANNYRHIQGWLLGTTLDRSNLDSSRIVASRLTRFPQWLARPVVGEAMEMFGQYSRMSDSLAIPVPLPTRIRSASEAGQIMQTDLRPLAGRTSALVSIVTQMPDEWFVQKTIANRTLRTNASSTFDYDLLQVRLQFYRSMMQGARGFIFRSASPLDAGDLTSQKRGEGYASINMEIDLLMPWIQAGQSTWRTIPTDSPNHTATVLETPKSQLAIIIASGPMDQICSVAPATERLKVTLPVSGQMRSVYRITHGELEPMRPEQTPGGWQVVIENPAMIEQIVSAADAMPLTYLRDKLSQPEVTAGLVSSRIDMSAQVIELAQLSMNSQRVSASDPRWEEIKRAESLQRSAMILLRRSNIPQAMKSADQALLIAQRVVRGSWEEATSEFGAFQSTPLLASPLSLPIHWEFIQLLAGRNAQNIAVPGVPFRDTAQLYESQWQVDRRLIENVQSDCLVGAIGPDGLPTLVVTARSMQGQPIPSGYGGAVMRVSSPPISAPAGAMIHVEGLVRIQSPVGETQSGLLVSDSLGGESLGQLISSADTSQYEWRRFDLIRFVTEERALRIHFETRGEMKAEVANITAKMIMPSQPNEILTRPYFPSEALTDAQEAIPISTSSNR
ncbi:MAG: hypothetical protein NTY15_14400 [Planctomycetota bacterium]|nr:hypothetical protein [Planctomycetota bacterium]